ncbi:hypothetical protein [Rubrobacter tropicus]|uniref:hypothetical protein n=1 Tax=Rubrobacter tropicus TaxID=2653851 RepID=UPI00140A384A|nr:hypothetical protein [Rubrobacter tropicus]
MLRGPMGRTPGRVQQVLVIGGYEPEYVEVSPGLLGFRSALTPVLGVAVDDERRVLTLQ